MKNLRINRRIRPVAFAALGLVAIAAAGAWGWHWWSVDRFLESTTDAYLKADYTIIAPKVSGYISEVLVEDNQPVKAGDVLARIDERDLVTALAQAKADVAAAESDVSNLDAQLARQQSVIEQANAAIAVDQAGVTFAQQDSQRYRDLMRTGYGTVQRAQQTDASLRQQQAILVRDRAAVAAAQQQVDVLKTARAKAEAELEHDHAVQAQAELNLGYATIVSPIDGTVGARTVRVGQYVQAGTQLMAVVPLQSVYVVANFKETQLTHLLSGQPATVEVDTFPGVAIHGHVDSLSPASGLEFALLPPDNATGNFTKIVQRIPVKIVLDADSRLAGQLRPGMSVVSTIDTRVSQPATGLGETAPASKRSLATLATR